MNLLLSPVVFTQPSSVQNEMLSKYNILFVGNIINTGRHPEEIHVIDENWFEDGYDVEFNKYMDV